MKSRALTFRCFFAVALATLVLLPFEVVGQAPSNDALSAGDLLFTEFFEGWSKYDPATGTVSTLPWQAPHGFPRSIQFDTDGAVLYDNGSDTIFRLNPSTGHATSLNVQGLSLIDGFIVEPSGDLLIANSREVSRFSRTTGLTSTVATQDFFSPNGIAISPAARVFITEFFDDLLEVNPTTGVATPVTSIPLSIPGLIEVRSDGDLIVENFSPNLLYRVNPDTGGVSTFTDDLPTFVSDMKLDSDDNLWVTSTDGLYYYESSGGAGTLVYDQTFFSPGALAIVPAGYAAPPVPEPTSVALLALGCLRVATCLSRSRRPAY